MISQCLLIQKIQSFSNDQINDQKKANISDFGLEVLKIIKEFPGIKVPEIVEKLQMKDLVVNADKVRNEIKRNLFNYIEYKGSNKTGGYYLKQFLVSSSSILTVKQYSGASKH